MAVFALVTCLSFALTIASLQLTSRLVPLLDPRHLLAALALGPLLGLWGLLGRGVEYYSWDRRTIVEFRPMAIFKRFTVGGLVLLSILRQDQQYKA
ncbi:hypothetical protein SAMN04487998_1978 [Hymenobacter actinosclerus]|uniref:Uncharacterized protein n=1 Tax=Hymenobacter actinosclerus TaxID=82805 RepID=A0A1I0ES90_9BACT|nr:hypothetical protein SAMN04487998_1978 [Hymenobacter actinosclerus]